ncbi:MAG: LysM domain-containing protein [Chloroflexota bacterium]|nr:LysM domain-containing protein [Chloroflexota bacterium]
MPSATEVARLETDLAEGTTPVGVVGEVPVFGLRPLPSSFEQYQVKRGETLDTIADAWSLTVPDLLLWNSHLEEDSILIPGEWLSIPQWDAPAVAEESGLSADDGKSGRGGG